MLLRNIYEKIDTRTNWICNRPAIQNNCVNENIKYGVNDTIDNHKIDYYNLYNYWGKLVPNIMID